MRWLVLSASFCVACSGEGDPQAQLLLVIDIDAPVIGQIAGEPALSSDAAVDTVRIDAVAVTESSEPQAVIGSDLHRLAYPSAYAAHVSRGQRLTTAIHHGSSQALGIQARGEYLYVADGPGGFRVFDIAQINQKGFSQKIVTAPVSPLGQNTSVGARFVTAVAAPSTLAVDPGRSRRPENKEQAIQVLSERTRQSADDVRATYELYVERERAFPVGARPTPDGVQAVLDALVEMGELQRPTPPIGKYVDTSYVERYGQ